MDKIDSKSEYIKQKERWRKELERNTTLEIHFDRADFDKTDSKVKTKNLSEIFRNNLFKSLIWGFCITILLFAFISLDSKNLITIAVGIILFHRFKVPINFIYSSLGVCA